MTENATDSTQIDENHQDDTNTAETQENAGESHSATFDADYVKALREESAGYRARSKNAEARATDLEQRLHKNLVAATRKLADPSDLPFDAEHLEDPEKLDAAIDSLIEAKPHLASRKPVGDIGQGRRGTSAQPFNLLETLKSRV